MYPMDDQKVVEALNLISYLLHSRTTFFTSSVLSGRMTARGRGVLWS
jgi:hypothetical protein